MKANGGSDWQDSKTGKWKYQVRVVQLGSKPKFVQRTASSKQEAAQLADELYLAHKPATVQANPRTLGDLVANYLIIKASHVTGSTLANSKYLPDKYVLPDFGGKLHRDGSLFHHVGKSKIDPAICSSFRCHAWINRSLEDAFETPRWSKTSN
jgi:hypothetical protein